MDGAVRNTSPLKRAWF